MTKPKFGILGGGQLARMLAFRAHPLGLEVHVLTGHATDPAAQVCATTHLGSLDDAATLRSFTAGINFVTFESEFVDTEKLAKCLKPTTQVFPHLKIIAEIQDRLTQKQLIDRAGIPTSPWVAVNSEDDLRQAARHFKDGFVLKQRRFGYDGYGTFVYPKTHKIKTLDVSPLAKSPHGFIAEALVKFKRELAVSLVRARTGQLVELPLVESVQKNSRCFSVCGPVKHPKFSSLRAKFARLMKQIDYHGVLAVEMFDTGRDLLVNELAPRVHNSAHYSQNALNCDQFEYHIRAGLGLPLPKPQLLRPGFAMVNLLGEGQREIQLSHNAAGHLHWYGKSENRQGRKMGHINVLDKSPRAALSRALKWRKEFQL